MAKKRSAAASLASEPQLKRPKAAVDLNEDALGVVMEFLAPKELFLMARTCKATRAAVTTRMVVRSAIMHGAGPKKYSGRSLLFIEERYHIHSVPVEAAATRQRKAMRSVQQDQSEACQSMSRHIPLLSLPRTRR